MLFLIFLSLKAILTSKDDAMGIKPGGTNQV